MDAAPMALTFELDPSTLREVQQWDGEGFVAFGAGGEPEDFIVIQMTLKNFMALGQPERLAVSFTPS